MNCPGHAGVNGTDQADRPAGKGKITVGSHLGRAEMLSLRHCLRAQSKGHGTIHHLVERGTERDGAQ